MQESVVHFATVLVVNGRYDMVLNVSPDTAPRSDVLDRHGIPGTSAEPPRTSTAEPGRQADPLKADVQEEPTTSTRPASAIEPRSIEDIPRGLTEQELDEVIEQRAVRRWVEDIKRSLGLWDDDD